MHGFGDDIVDVWSNGGSPNDSNIYGVAVASDPPVLHTMIDYVGGGMRMSVPEPATLGLLAIGFALTGFASRRRQAAGGWDSAAEPGYPPPTGAAAPST